MSLSAKIATALIAMMVPVLATPALAQGPCKAAAVAATHTSPPYPSISRKLGEQGMADLLVVMGLTGAVRDISLLASSGSPRLDEAAIQHVRDGWLWTPGACHQTRVQVTFALWDAGMFTASRSDAEKATIR